MSDDLIGVAMAHEDGCLLVRAGGGDEVLDLPLQEQVAAQAKDAAELVLVGGAREQCHGAALGEAANDDAVRGDALGDLGFDERVEVVARL